MSRIGIKPITIPDGVTVDSKDNLVTVKGKTSTLTQEIHPNIIVEIMAIPRPLITLGISLTFV